MIIELVMNVIYSVISLLTTPINIPDLPAQLANIISSVADYISIGIGILSNYTHYTYLAVIFGVIIAVDIAMHLYQLVMFILRKIPFLNLK